jgi:hypothetical protein
MRRCHPASKTIPNFSESVSFAAPCRAQEDFMRTPAGVGPAGGTLWRSTVEVFDFTDEPHKVQILTQVCRVADVVAELDEAADEAPLTVKGSMGQQVISPFIAEAGAQRALLAQLLSRLGLPETDEEAEAKAAKVSRIRRRAAKGGSS